MPFYVILSTLTDDGLETVKKKPQRILEVNKELEEMGIKVIYQFAVLGQYDFVSIIEAPDNETVMKMSVELGSRGTVKLTSLPALKIEDFINLVKK
ncbi:MAG: GYD domain-containing protein [Thermodesulfobacterium sp.]|nr:GYD domain-containing protein [Thermodesulfobacterium sp.]